MRRRLGRFVTRALAVSVTLIGLTIAAAAMPTSSPRDRAAAWAKSLTVAERQIYSQGQKLAGLPLDYRKAVFTVLSTTEERTTFWQSVFTAYRQQHVLSSAQDLTLTKAEAMIAVMFRALPSERPAQEAALARVSDEVRRVLGPQAQLELFKTAGPDGTIDGLPIAERVVLHLRAWSHANVVARAAFRLVPTLFADWGPCNCNDEHPSDCHYEQHCTLGLNGCTETGGCNCDFIFFNCWTCDGVCNYAIEG